MLVRCIEEGDDSCMQFFKLLSLCHTVMAETKNGKLVVVFHLMVLLMSLNSVGVIFPSEAIS